MMTAAQQTGENHRRFGRHALIRAVYISAFIAVLVWLGGANDSLGEWYSFTGREKNTDYYNLLVHGFQQGHSYMDATPDPRLLSPIPALREGAPTLLDAGFYQGHFYLYYGVTPLVLMMLPYSLLTGSDLSPNVVTCASVLLGFFASAALIAQLRRDYLPKPAPWFEPFALALLAFAPATMFLLRRSMFYEVPLATGYACVMALAYFLYSGYRDRSGHWASWLASSVCFGLAVGCHPNLLFLGPILVAALWLSERQWAESPSPRRWGALIGPALLLGMLLASYNALRFGHPLESGFRYGQNKFFGLPDRLASPDFIWTNLRWYYFTPPTLTPYFPFVFPANTSFRPPGYHGFEVIHGQFPFTLLALWTALGLGLIPRSRMPGGIKLVLAGTALAGLSGLAFIAVLGIRADRYMVDGHAPLLLGTVVLAAWVWSQSPRSVPGSIWRGVWGGLSVALVLFNLCASIQQFDQFRITRGRTQALLERTFNPSWGTLRKLGLVKFKPGPLAFDVVFAPQTKAVVEPLVTTGTPYYSDTVFAIQHPSDQIEILVDHFGTGGPRSKLIPIVPGRSYHFEVSIGSFYPLRGDAFYDRMDPKLVEMLKTAATVSIDHETVVYRRMSFHESPPWARWFGNNPVTLTEFGRTFSGKISDIHALALQDPRSARQEDKRGVFRLEVRFPDTPPAFAQPILAAGLTGKGTLLFAAPLAGGYRFAVDQWGIGGDSGPVVPWSPGEHILDIVVGPLAAEFAWEGEAKDHAGQIRQRLLVSVDGALVANLPLSQNSDAFDILDFGRNDQGFSTAEAGFRGTLERILLSQPQADKVVSSLAVLAEHQK